MLFKGLTTLFAFLAVNVHATPLSRRDVIAPHITSPHEGTVWPIGTVQTVTWDTSNFPPDSQITNPIGQVILGFNSSNSLNLDFVVPLFLPNRSTNHEHPLAKNFKLRDGKVNITVPNVPPKDDYLIVLFGDSGNTSPAFAITKISGSSGSSNATSSEPRSSSASSAAAASTTSNLITTPIPITGSVITGGVSSTSDAAGSGAGSTTETSPAPTATSPVISSSSSSASDASLSTSASSTSSAPQTSQSQPSSASSLLHTPSVGGGMIMTALIMLVMV
ncbi:hypothetical protein D9613_005653 [Agrocybe pediades]|uniref:Uncharacterized protein n=1 Tax=Agrocybe pediades TaxID=84607 RepID=A0A8H4QWN4_9AGAR|nr:hypothetical protein D9613_005653 [Agrocybe pediades]